MSELLLLVTGRALLMSPKGRNASRDGLVKIGCVVYSLLFPYIFSLSSMIVNALFRSYAALPIRCKVYNFLSSLMIFRNKTGPTHKFSYQFPKGRDNTFCFTISEICYQVVDLFHDLVQSHRHDICDIKFHDCTYVLWSLN